MNEMMGFIVGGGVIGGGGERGGQGESGAFRGMKGGGNG